MPGLSLRVTDRGHKSFILAARYPMHPKNPTRRAFGMVGSLTVNTACDKARRWLDLISKEIDPKTEEERLQAEAKRRQDATFGRVANDFLDRRAVKFAKAKEVQSSRPSLMPRWRDRPIEDVLPAMSRRRSGPSLPAAAQAQARSAVADLCNLFNWATATDEYEITQSPLGHLKQRGADRGSGGASAHLDQRQVAGGVERRRCDGLSVRGRFQVADPDRIGQG